MKSKHIFETELVANKGFKTCIFILLFQNFLDDEEDEWSILNLFLSLLHQKYDPNQFKGVVCNALIPELLQP